MDELKRAVDWHKQAVPIPTDKNKCIALGVHFEEISEMFEALGLPQHERQMHLLANAFKSCDVVAMEVSLSANKIKLLDAILDQNVTLCGISNAFGFSHIDGLAEVNDSNYSKFEDNKPVFNNQGKISKGKHYKPPQLDKFI